MVLIATEDLLKRTERAKTMIILCGANIMEVKFLGLCYPMNMAHTINDPHGSLYT